MPVSVAAPRSTAEELAATLKLAWPLVASNLASNAITTTDVLMLGWLGPEPLAASALAVNLYNLVVFTGVGLSVAISPMVAAALGAKVEAVRETRRTFRMGLWMATIFAALAMLILSFAEPLFLLLGQDPRLSALAGDFMAIAMWAVWPTLLLFVLKNLLTALGRTWVPLVVAIGGVGVNALLNYALIFGAWGAPALGLEGSAIATVLTNIAMLLALAVFLVRLPRVRLMHLFGRWWRADWPRLRELFRLGLPIGALWAFEVGVFSAAIYLMGLLDTVSVAAHVIALQIAGMAFMVPLGLAQAGTVRVGYGYGAADPVWIARAGRVSIGCAMAFAVASASVMWLFPAELAGLFLDETQPESAAVLALAVQFLLIAAVFQLADGAQTIGASILRGLQDTRAAMIYALVGYWVVGLGAAILLTFPLGFGGRGIWIGLALGLGAVAVLTLGRWLGRERLGLLPSSAAERHIDG